MFPESIFSDLQDGRVVLVTGAGVSGRGTNRVGKPIVGADALAKLIAEAADLPYSEEELKEVFDAAEESLGSAKLKKIFEDNFTQTTPSDPLVRLFGTPWRRAYTFNVDDTIERIPTKRTAQKLRFFNALRDRREEWRGYNECQVIHLHGFAGQAEAGYIFSSDQYADAAAKNPAWYTQLGEDFIDYTVVFVGTKVKEQILFQTVRAALTKGTSPGRSFCVIPDELTEIQTRSLERRGIVHIRATLEDFVAEIDRHFPKGLSSRDLDIADSAAGASQKIRFTDSDVDALRAVFPISSKDLEKRYPSNTTDFSKINRRFYEGYGPSWPVLMRGAYAELSQFARLRSEIADLISSKRAVVVLGEAGSGKSTFVMHCAQNIAKSDSGLIAFEYSEGNVTFKETMYSLKKYREDKRCIVALDDLHVLGDEVADALSERMMEGGNYSDEC